jgi:hypothetical protein
MDFISEYRVLDLHERQDPPGIRGVCALQIWSVMGGWVLFFNQDYASSMLFDGLTKYYAPRLGYMDGMVGIGTG